MAIGTHVSRGNSADQRTFIQGKRLEYEISYNAIGRFSVKKKRDSGIILSTKQARARPYQG